MLDEHPIKRRARLEGRKLTWIAQRARLAPSRLSDIIAGRRKPREGDLERLAAASGVGLDELEAWQRAADSLGE